MQIFPYKLYHYNCNEVDDSGWGCVYRNVQTIISALNCLMSIQKVNIPNIKDMLIYFGKEIYGSGSSMWIEPYHAEKFISDYLKIYQKDIITKQVLWLMNENSIIHIVQTPIEIYTAKNNEILSGNEIKKFSILIREYSLTKKIPVLLDNGTYSYLGISQINQNGITQDYIIDPHRTSSAKIIECVFEEWLPKNECWMSLFLY